MDRATCSVCRCSVSSDVLDWFDCTNGAGIPVCFGCLALADETAVDGGPLPWELTLDIAALLLANDNYDAGEAA